ncbi:MAG TPA: efflux RND transporter periplasmic adaptor subunit, partial [Candidatus Paceibacterota bacterium]|nr:efflux RND transporter periplasmic adaptor subunit [Candidatus Paceibacterota bacterium]
TLAALDTAALQAGVEQAQAGLSAQQAKLAALQAGATPQTLAAAQTAVSNAQAQLAQSKQTLVQASQDAYLKSDDAIHDRVDQFFNNPRGVNPSLFFNLTDSQLQISIISGRIGMESLLSQWQSFETSLPTDATQIDPSAVAAQVRGFVTQVGNYLDMVAHGLTLAIPTTNYTLSTIQSYQTSVATGRTNVSGGLAAVDAATIASQNAASSLAAAQAQLTVTSAPPTQNDVNAQEAAVASAQASLDAARAQLNNAFIVAPIGGTITVQNAHVGATASPGSPMISMNSNAQFQIDCYVSELDLAKLSVGNQASVSLDAYAGDTPIPAHVITIDPAATMQNGVAAYKISLQFDNNDAREKAGLTGNVKIMTGSASDALSVPQSAIITQGAQRYVLKQTPNGDQLTPVTTGITSANGMTQILAGLSAGDKIRAFGAQQ